MIYSKFGTLLTPVSKHQASDGQLYVQATAGDAPEVLEYAVGQMKADGGPAEIEHVLANLPWKVMLGRKSQRVDQRR